MPIDPLYRTPAGLTDELRRVVRIHGNCVLGTINEDGSPHLTELLYMLDEHDRPLLPTPRTTRKFKNLQARPTATFFVSLTRTGGWASCTGPARLVTGEEARRLNQTIRDHLLTDAGHATIGRALAAFEDTTIIIEPRNWLSWKGGQTLLDSITNLGGDIEAHPPGTWFRDLGEP